MNMYNVVVEKVGYYMGTIKVRADNEQEAKDKVMRGIRTKHIHTYQVAWGDPKYHDGSFQNTGDVE